MDSMMPELTTIGTIAGIAGIVALGVPDAEAIKAASGLPMEVILGAVAAWLAWLNYKMSTKFADKTAEMVEKQGKRWDAAIEAWNTFTQELKGRPCFYLHGRDGDPEPRKHMRKEDV